MEKELTIRVLGTGDSMGVPRVYCSCPVCAEARDTGVNRRFRSSILLENGNRELWVDCGPDWRTQMEMNGRLMAGDFLITHAHYDHIGGLPELADLCRWTKARCRVYAPEEVLATIRKQFPWIEKNLEFVGIVDLLDWAGWKVIPFRVCHGKNGYSYAYRFEGGDKAWVYCPDSIHLQAGEKASMKNLDLLVLGTSFYKEEAEFHTRSVYDMMEAQELIKEMKPARVVFTHMSHNVDMRRNYPLMEGIRLAQTGDVYCV